MPVYEYICGGCGRRVRLFMSYVEYDQAAPACPHCASRELRRRVGRVSVSRSEASRLDALTDDGAISGLADDDPRALGRYMRQMSREMGEDMGTEFDEVVGRLESGESPASIEASMPTVPNESDLTAGD